MSEQLWWHVARAGGIVALALATASIIWGLLLSSGVLQHHPPKRWLLSMHSWLGGLTVTFTAVHVAGLWLDSYVHYSIADLTVPFVATQTPGRWPIAWGVIAMYLLVAVQATSLLRRWLPRRWWRAVHMASFGVMVAGIVHGANAGTDISNRVYIVSVFGGVLLTVYLSTFRLLTRRRRVDRRTGHHRAMRSTSIPHEPGTPRPATVVATGAHDRMKSRVSCGSQSSDVPPDTEAASS